MYLSAINSRVKSCMQIVANCFRSGTLIFPRHACLWDNYHIPLIPEMPHRRAHSYFSGLTVISAPFQAVSKASSTDELRELQLDPYKRTYSTTLSKSTDHLEVCKQRIEEELDSEVQDLLSRPPKYKEVVPTSIKFAVSKPSTSPSTMARPRSPSKASNTDMLDQTLLRIRKRLVSS